MFTLIWWMGMIFLKELYVVVLNDMSEKSFFFFNEKREIFFKWIVLGKTIIHVLLINLWSYHHAPMVRWSLHKYKCLCGVEGKGRNSSLQKEISYTYTLRLSYSRNSILYKKIIIIKLKKNNLWSCTNLIVGLGCESCDICHNFCVDWMRGFMIV